jgi:uncharacterized membrane protein
MDKEEKDEGEGISLKFALWLALGLVSMVLVLNLLGSPEVPVGIEHFRRLEKDGVIAAVKISPAGWHVELKRPSRIENSGGEFITKQVVVRGQAEPSGGVVSGWEPKGIAVEYIAEPVRQAGWVGGVLVAGLLGLGLWHLWQQMQRHRREGSPRQHLEKLEQEFKEGKISQEEFQKRAELIMAEM